MRIFSAAESRTVASQRAQQDADRAKGIDKITAQILRDHDEAQRTFEEGVKRRIKESEEFERVENEKKNKLKREIEELEARKARALLPLLDREAIIKSAEDALRQREAEVERREADAEDSQRRIMQKLDDIYVREEDLRQKEARFKVQEEGGRRQREQIAQDAQRLGKSIADFVKRSDEREKEITRKRAVLEAEKNLWAQKDANLLGREQNVKKEWQKVLDGRVQLEQAWKEFRNKK